MRSAIIISTILHILIFVLLYIKLPKFKKEEVQHKPSIAINLLPNKENEAFHSQKIIDKSSPKSSAKKPEEKEITPPMNKAPQPRVQKPELKQKEEITPPKQGKKLIPPVKPENPVLTLKKKEKIDEPAPKKEQSSDKKIKDEKSKEAAKTINKNNAEKKKIEELKKPEPKKKEKPIENDFDTLLKSLEEETTTGNKLQNQSVAPSFTLSAYEDNLIREQVKPNYMALGNTKRKIIGNIYIKTDIHCNIIERKLDTPPNTQDALQNIFLKIIERKVKDTQKLEGLSPETCRKLSQEGMLLDFHYPPFT